MNLRNKKPSLEHKKTRFCANYWEGPVHFLFPASRTDMLLFDIILDCMSGLSRGPHSGF